jgi:hypothetical protein
MNAYSTLLARVGCTAALALLAGSLSTSAAFANKAKTATEELSMKIKKQGNGADQLKVTFGKTIDLNSAKMTVKRTINGKEETSTVKGVVSPTDNSILLYNTKDFTFSDGVKKFSTSDFVEFNMVLNIQPKEKITVKQAGFYDSGNKGVAQSIRKNGFDFEIDPDYTLYNDLDITSPATDSQMQIENLQFHSNLTPSQFDALDLESLFSQPITSAFTLSSSQASSPSFPTSRLFSGGDITEPDFGNYNVAEGLIVDPDTGDTTSFIDAIQADTPEPGALSLLVGLGVSGSVFAFKRRRK